MEKGVNITGDAYPADEVFTPIVEENDNGNGGGKNNQLSDGKSSRKISSELGSD